MIGVLLALIVALFTAPPVYGPPTPIDTPCAIGWERTVTGCER